MVPASYAFKWLCLLLLLGLLLPGTLSAQGCDDGTPRFTELNISTAVAANDSVLPPGSVDPLWKLINFPPLSSTAPAGISPDAAYAVSTYRPGGNPWWNILDDTTLTAGILNVVPTATFGANNANRGQPWRFRRQFCLCAEAEVTIAGALQADDRGTLRLYQDNNPVPLATLASSDNTTPTTNFKRDAPFSYSANLPPGNYHLEFEMVNISSRAMGFTVGASISLLEPAEILGNGQSACEAGVISIQKIEDRNCDGARTSREPGLAGWDFTLTETTTGQVYTATTDVYGEIVLRNLPYGNYLVEEVIVPPFTPTFPVNGQATVTLDAENSVGVITFGNASPESCTCISAEVTGLEIDQECCYELFLTNDYGAYYDSITVSGVGFFTDLLNNTSSWGTRSQTGDVISLDGVVPVGQFQPALTFCTDGLDGEGIVLVEWWFEGELVCSEEVEISCPDNCPGLLIENTTEDDCCAEITYRNTGNRMVGGLAFRMQSGAGFDVASIVPAPGLALFAASDTRFIVGTTSSAGLPPLVDDVSLFCLKEVTDSQQVIVVDYLESDLRTVICSDTLIMECPVSPLCLIQDVLSPQVDCEEDGYRLRLIFEKADDYIDSVGLIKIVLTDPAVLGGPLEFPLASGLGAGDNITIDTFLPFSLLGDADSLCFFITAHDGPEERLCCFADSICIPLPDCANPCDSLTAYLTPTSEDSCCYDVFLDVNYASDPGLLQQVDIRLLDGPTDAFSGFNLIPTAAGWNIVSETSPGVAYTLTPGAGTAPLGNGQQVFQFCIDETFSTDSTRVEITWQSANDTLCADTLAGFCAGCLTIPQDTVLCGAMSDVYLFTFTNNSPFPVNAVSILDSDAAPGDQLLNAQTHFLGVTVPVGGTFQSFIPVDFIDANGDGELCFDIVLRLLVEGELPILCCYATHCVQLEDCPAGSEDPCVFEEPNEMPDCPLTYEPVCGCNGETYANRCYALEAGIVNWTGGPCPGTPPVIDAWNPTRTEYVDGEVIVEIGSLTAIEDVVGSGVILQRYRESDDSWWSKATSLNTTEDVSLTDPNPLSGSQLYRVLFITSTGEPRSSFERFVVVPDRRPNITASPNPAASVVFLESDRTGAASIGLLNATGQESALGEVTFANQPVPVELGRRLPGVYTIVVRMLDGGTGLQRIVIR